ncbi:FAD-dependent oxidoreductase [Sansalvadorimonas sp. 2012CJ34-2]|uniref:FAD-dependent oxidoreductase n=1 Tax=Parendozoicomonas callyspongiae TaxID=2942213 RepID=A0ABT0PG46_9GAMM|nr:FAD-dependent oxidoreductase [Sansalvadorimonas sp. 2012CJ34-2]MCL6270295.1 FAD-dependent oxidoreductase [Sansalvadorimonas sp. 2012CJ34-2]
MSANEIIAVSETTLEKFQPIADKCMGEASPYCQANCPMHTDVKGYVGHIGKGEYSEAVSVIREKLFIPRTLGRICAHPCEEACKRNEHHEPLSVAQLKRFVCDSHDKEKNWDLTKEQDSGKRVAVIGAGPAGAQAALDLCRKGHAVTIFDRLPEKGGMLRVGIPAYRLPRDIIDHEYSLLDKLGIEFKMGVDIGKDISFDEIKEQHDAVVLAIGAHQGVVIPVEGSHRHGVFDAVDFLRDISLKGEYPKAGKKVLVIGGGNVAMDCARSAVRLPQVEKVYLTCLEGDIASMPAHDWEVEEAIEEGVDVRTGFGPHEISGHDHVTGMTVKPCLSLFDAQGNFAPSFDEEKLQELDVDTVVFAVGQKVENQTFALETDSRGRIAGNSLTLQTSDQKVFVAGDAHGTGIAIEAMEEGRRAAESVHRLLTGQNLETGRERFSHQTKLDTVIPNADARPQRLHTALRDPEERVKDFHEADFGFREEDALKEASRCLQCECRLCMQTCTMLNDYCHSPQELSCAVLKSGKLSPEVAFSCNMCSSCTLVCPHDFDIKGALMSARVDMVKANNGESPMKGHKAIKVHQALGFSKVFNTVQKAPEYKPDNKKRVFIPGCSLPSYNPELVEKTFSYLKEKMPGIGSILMCCGKPTKALGQQELFKERFAQLQNAIDESGAEEIIVACQSCYLTLSEYAKQPVRSLWQILPELGLPEGVKGVGEGSDVTFAIHDSCSTRHVSSIHDGVRWVMNEMGYRTEEPPHTRETAKCCGFGGMVVPANPGLASRVMDSRTEEVESGHMVSYCAACRESMEKGGKDSVHILDLVFGEMYMKDSAEQRNHGAVKSWVNRYKSKRGLIQVANI